MPRLFSAVLRSAARLAWGDLPVDATAGPRGR